MKDCHKTMIVWNFNEFYDQSTRVSPVAKLKLPQVFIDVAHNKEGYV